MVNATQQVWTVNSIQAAVRATGSHWFDPDTMRFFGTRVLPTVYQGPGGVYFVTSDKDYDGTRRHSVRQFTPPGEVGTVGDVASLTKAQAVALAKKSAAGKGLIGFSKLVPEEEGGLPWAARGVKESVEEFRPVTVLEQFLADLRQHGSSEATAHKAALLMRWAAKHHRMMEDYCNGAEMYDEDGEPVTRLCTLRANIRTAAMQCGATAVIFSGDPRGCTVKLTFPGGATNDFGREGYCVPTND